MTGEATIFRLHLSYGIAGIAIPAYELRFATGSAGAIMLPHPYVARP